MKLKLKKYLEIIIEYFFYLFIFIFPWQTKIILRSALTNFTEISLYVSQILLLLTLIFFFIYRLYWPEKNNKIPYLWGALSILELMILVSFFFAPDQLLAFYYYVLFLLGVGLFYLLRSGQSNSESGKGLLKQTKIIYTFLASIFLQAILGIYQFLTQTTPVYKFLGLAAHDPSLLGVSVVETASGRWLRAYGGLDHPNILGGVLAISLITVAYFLARKKVIRSKLEISESLFLFIFYFVSLFALFFTFSRSAYLAFFVGLLVLLICFIVKKDRWILGRFLVLLFFSISMISLVAYPYRDLVSTRINNSTRLEQKSIQERQNYFLQAKQVIKNHWVFGVGIGNYTTALNQESSRHKNIWFYQPVHNVFLLLWAESGIFALLSFLAFLVLLKKDRRTILSWAIFSALFILMLLDHWLLSLPFGLLFLFLVLGLL